MRAGAVVLAGILFAVIGFAHLSRLFYPFSVSIAGWEFPVWLSVAVFILLGTLSARMFRSVSDFI